MVDIRDVAKRAGVAPITVSRCINHSGYCSPETRARVVALHPEIAVDGNVITLSGPALACKPALLQVLLSAQAAILNLSQQRATIEEIYLEAIRA